MKSNFEAWFNSFTVRNKPGNGDGAKDNRLSASSIGIGGNTVLVCGGRQFADRRRLFDALDQLHQKLPIGLVVHGAARGADMLGEEWATRREIAYLGIPAQWTRYQKGAGPRRNATMLRLVAADVVVVCPGGRGTENMRSQSEQAGIGIYEI